MRDRDITVEKKTMKKKVQQKQQQKQEEIVEVEVMGVSRHGNRRAPVLPLRIPRGRHREGNYSASAPPSSLPLSFSKPARRISDGKRSPSSSKMKGLAGSEDSVLDSSSSTPSSMKTSASSHISPWDMDLWEDHSKGRHGNDNNSSSSSSSSGNDGIDSGDGSFPRRHQTTRSTPLEMKPNRSRRSISKFFKMADLEDSDEDQNDNDDGAQPPPPPPPLQEDKHRTAGREDNLERRGPTMYDCDHRDGTNGDEMMRPLVESPRKKSKPTAVAADGGDDDGDQISQHESIIPPISAAEFTRSVPSNDMERKRELLLLFLLQHVARELNPDPLYFAQLAKLLLKEGLLTDKKYADFVYLKEQTKGFTREIMSFLPPISFGKEAGNDLGGPGTSNESASLKRAGSVDSFLSAGQPLQPIEPKEDETDHPFAIHQQVNPFPESNRLLEWVRNASAQHPVLDFLFSSPSRFNTDFINRQRIGRGAFGNVYRAQHRIDGVTYAIKRIKFSFRNVRELETAFERVVREVKSLAQLSHPNIVRYNQAWFEPLRQNERDFEEREKRKEKDLHGEMDDDFDDEEEEEKEESDDGYDSIGIESQHAISSFNPCPSPRSIDDSCEARRSMNHHFLDSGMDNNDDKSSIDDDSEDATDFGVEFDFDEEIGPSEMQVQTSSTTMQNVEMDFSSRRLQLPPQQMSDDMHSFSPKDMSYLMYAMQKKSATGLKLTSSPLSPHHSRHHSQTSYATPKFKDPELVEHQAVESLVNKQSMEAVKSLLNEMFDQKKNKFEMCLYIQMELCSLSTLDNYLWSDQRSQKGQFDMKEVHMLFLQVCQAVDYIHAKGLIHRDIKPSNLFIADEHTVKLGDFGLAKIFHEMTVDESPDGDEVAETPISTASKSTTSLISSATKSSSTHTSGLGTPTYASPEQLNKVEYDEKTDIFSLGLIFFEMLHPFSTRSERAIVLSKVRQGEIPKHMLETYPHEMDLVKRCLDLDATQRPSARSVLHMVTDLMDKRGFSTSFPLLLATGTSLSQNVSIPVQPELSTVSSSAPSYSLTSSSPEALLQQIQEKDDEIDRLKKEIDQLRSVRS